MENKITVKKIVIGAAMLIFIVNCFNQLITINQINNSMEEQKRELEGIKEENKKLEAELERAKTDYEYLENLARERLGVIKEGEEIILPLEETEE